MLHSVSNDINLKMKAITSSLRRWNSLQLFHNKKLSGKEKFNFRLGEENPSKLAVRRNV